MGLKCELDSKSEGNEKGVDGFEKGLSFAPHTKGTATHTAQT